MQFTTSIITAILAYAALQVTAAALPQLAGEGAACNSIFSSTDNGVGYGIENAENNVAGNVGTVTHIARRQLAGEGAACNSIFSSTDNGVGYGVENAEDNTANLISSTTGSVSGGGNNGGAPAGPGGPGGPRVRRQLDKIANGAQHIADAAGAGFATAPVTGALDMVDGVTTGGAADAGAQIGHAEESTLEQIGSSVP